MSRAPFLLAAIALAAGVLAAFASDPRPAAAGDEVSALQLAEWIRARRPGLLVLDLRAPHDSATAHLPGARSSAEMDIEALAGHHVIVVYAEDEVTEPMAAALRRQWKLPGLLRLQGGIKAWNEHVMFPQIRADAPARPRAKFDARARLSRYFGGAPRVLEDGEASTPMRSRRGC